jgi:hypothetical protein
VITDACLRARLTGTVFVGLAPRAAFGLFTPNGERAWAKGWEPRFPSPDGEETEPGTVFLTSHSGRESIWTVTECEAGASIGYAVTTPGERSGVVRVVCEPAPNGTRATVSYDLTALSAEANEDLRRFATDYATFLSHWERTIAEATGQRSRRSSSWQPSSSNPAPAISADICQSD